MIKIDGFVKSRVPFGRAALRCILRHCGVATSTPHSSGFARLRVPTCGCGPFTKPSAVETFYEAVKIENYNHKFIMRMIWVLLIGMSISGCAADKPVRKDAFLEEWKTAAKESQGHSPSAGYEEVVVSGAKAVVTDSSKTGREGETSVKTLPVSLVSLNIRQVDVKTVLRTLGRISGLNILIKNDIKGDVSIDFKDVPWNDAFNSILYSQGLSYAWEGDILRVMTLHDMENDLRLLDIKDKRLAKDLSTRLSEPMFTSVININYTDAKALKEDLQEFLTKDKEGKVRGSVRVNEDNNAVVIQAIQDDLDKMVSIIKTLDKPIYQILIKANIVETSSDLARNLGVRWGGVYGGKSGDVSESLGLVFGTIGGNALEMQLNTLQKDGKLNILSSPSITTLDNQKAFTETGEKVPFVVTDTTGTTGSAGAVPARTVKFENAVLRLEIVPHVIDSKNLKMKIWVQKDEVDMTRQVEGNPFILKKHAETSLIVQDGETIVISGLTKPKRAESTNGVTGLKDIPFLGWFLKGLSKSESMEEVLIFITPHILPPQVAGMGKEQIGR